MSQNSSTEEQAMRYTGYFRYDRKPNRWIHDIKVKHAFANNEDNTLQIGFVIALADKYENCNIINYSSK